MVSNEKKIKGNFNLDHETEIILKAIPVVNSLFDKTDKSLYNLFINQSKAL